MVQVSVLRVGRRGWVGDRTITRSQKNRDRGGSDLQVLEPDTIVRPSKLNSGRSLDLDKLGNGERSMVCAATSVSDRRRLTSLACRSGPLRTLLVEDNQGSRGMVVSVQRDLDENKLLGNRVLDFNPQ